MIDENYNSEFEFDQNVTDKSIFGLNNELNNLSELNIENLKNEIISGDILIADYNRMKKKYEKIIEENKEIRLENVKIKDKGEKFCKKLKDEIKNLNFLNSQQSLKIQHLEEKSNIDDKFEDKKKLKILNSKIEKSIKDLEIKNKIISHIQKENLELKKKLEEKMILEKKLELEQKFEKETQTEINEENEKFENSVDDFDLLKGIQETKKKTIILDIENEKENKIVIDDHEDEDSDLMLNSLKIANKKIKKNKFKIKKMKKDFDEFKEKYKREVILENELLSSENIGKITKEVISSEIFNVFLKKFRKNTNKHKCNEQNKNESNKIL